MKALPRTLCCSSRVMLGGILLMVSFIGIWLGNPPNLAEDEMKRGSAQHLDDTKIKRTLEKFSSWQKRLDLSEDAERAAILADGIELALQRREVMASLIRENPTRAVKESLTLAEWSKLPAEIRNEVEKPFSRVAELSVLPVCTQSPRPRNHIDPHTVRLLHEPGQPTLTAYVAPGRAMMTSKKLLPAQGIQLGNEAALSDSPIVALSPEDAAVAASLYPLANPFPDQDFSTGQPLGPAPITAVSGGKRFLFSNIESLTALSQKLAALDFVPDPHISSSLVLAGYSNNPLLLNVDSPATNVLATSPDWTTTKKKLFVIRCDFSDFPSSTYPLLAKSTYESQLNGEISTAIQQFSYGKTWIEGTVSSSITRLPQPSTYYSGQPDENTANLALYDQALATFQSANPSFNAADYHIIGLSFTGIGMKISGGAYSGLAELGGTRLWMQGSIQSSVHVHELGHNLGLDHSNFWQRPVGSTNPVDSAGTDVNYGDPFDVMGSGSAPQGAFHAEAKQRLNWLTPSDWTAATTSGTYRIHRIDDPATTGSRGLRITRSTDNYYWLSYRRSLENPWLKAGAYVTWKQPGNLKSWLIDTTPNSLAGDADRTDGAILIGRTYSDPSAHIHLTAIGRTGTAPNESLDVRVNIGPFPGNVAPSASISGPSTMITGQAAVFSAIASDANGDSFAYDWDFGNGLTFDNNASVVMKWSSVGTYTVKCTVSDMKGGKTLVTKSVVVNDPAPTWTARTNSAVGDFYALVAGSTKLVAAGSGTQKEQSTNGPLAYSTDGTTWTSGKFSNYKHAYSGLWDGSKYVMAGLDYAFTNSGTIRRNPAGYYAAIFTATDVTFNSGVSTFTTRYLGTQANSPLWGIAYGGGIYVAVGDNGLILRSTDGLTWSVINAGISGNLTSVAYGNGKFVAVGRSDPYGNQKGFVYTSSDGSTWTSTTSGAGFAGQNFLFFWQIVYANDRFLASGWNCGLHYSTNGGTSFTPARENFAQEFTPAMTYGSGLWLASGYDQGNSNASVDLLSTDGSTWAKLTTPARADLVNSAIFFNSSFIMAGDTHKLWQGAPVYVTSRNFYDWRESYFPDRGALSIPSADSDGDGVPNLLEYVLGSSPVSSGGADALASLPQAAKITDNPLLADRVALQFSIPSPASGDVTHIVESATTLAGPWAVLATKTGGSPWVWSGGGTSRIFSGTTANGKTPVTVGDSQPISSASGRFLRLKTATAP